jgi:hypothetical protein
MDKPQNNIVATNKPKKNIVATFIMYNKDDSIRWKVCVQETNIGSFLMFEENDNAYYPELLASGGSIQECVINFLKANM